MPLPTFSTILLATTFSLSQAPAGPVAKVVRVTPPEITGAVEVSVGINPTNPDHLVAASIGRVREHPRVTDYAYVSNDAGKSWKLVPRENPHNVMQGDDVITFAPNGTAIHTFISFAGIRQARPRKAHSGIVTSSTKDGITWNPQVPVIELFNAVEPHDDKPWLKADMAKESKGYGNLYVAWTRFDVYGSANPDHKTHIYMSRSLDNGKSFTVPHKISEKPGDAKDKSDTLMGACPGIGPNGEVYIVWAGPKSLFFTQSGDLGHTFGKNSVIADCAGWDFNVAGIGRADGLPSIGADITNGKDRGTIYVCFGDARNGDPDVFLIVSRDGGKTWEKPKRINIDPKGNGREQWFPWMVVDPVDGSVNIAYYDRGETKDALSHITLARSVDGGQTFVYSRISDEAYDLTRLGFFGDYLGLDAFGGRVAVLWMHPLDKTKKLGISSVILDYVPGTQAAKMSKNAIGQK